MPRLLPTYQDSRGASRDRLQEYADLLEHSWADMGNSIAERNAAMPNASYIPPDVPADVPTEEAVRAVMETAHRSFMRDYRPDCRCGQCRRIREFATANPSGLDADGRDVDGFDVHGYDREGYTRMGFNRDGRDRDGYDTDGLNAEGYDRYGYDGDGLDADGYDREGYDADGYNADGDLRDSGSELHYYSYTPSRLRFNGDKPPWYGMEIEVTTDYPGRLVDVVSEHAGDLIYCKEDGSVDGAEMVTHPMSYDWAIENFPWDMLPQLREDADATVITSDNGIHVHVSRDGFDTPAHMFRFLKFWYRNPNDIQRIARRDSASWAAFRSGHRRSHKDHVKIANKASRYLSPGRTCECGDPGCYMTRNGPVNPNAYDRDNDGTLSRYSAVNTLNPNTLEVRVFASTLRPQRAQAALGLVAGTVEYTRQLRSQDVAQRHGWEWPAFIDWAGKDGRYPALIAENRTRPRR